MLKGLLKSQIHCSTFLQIIHMIPYSSLAISADGLKMKRINNLVFIFFRSPWVTGAFLDGISHVCSN